MLHIYIVIILAWLSFPGPIPSFCIDWEHGEWGASVVVSSSCIQCHKSVTLLCYFPLLRPMPVSVAYELSWDQSLPAWWPQRMLYCSVKDLPLAIGTCACMRVLGYYLAMIVSYFTRHYFYLMWLVNNSSMKTSHGEWFAASLCISVLTIFTFVDRATKKISM